MDNGNSPQSQRKWFKKKLFRKTDQLAHSRKAMPLVLYCRCNFIPTYLCVNLTRTVCHDNVCGIKYRSECNTLRCDLKTKNELFFILMQYQILCNFIAPAFSPVVQHWKIKAGAPCVRHIETHWELRKSCMPLELRTTTYQWAPNEFTVIYTIHRATG